MIPFGSDLWVSPDGSLFYYCHNQILEQHGAGGCEVTIRISPRKNLHSGLYLLGTYAVGPANRNIIPLINARLVSYFLQHAALVRQEISSKVP